MPPPPSRPSTEAFDATVVSVEPPDATEDTDATDDTEDTGDDPSMSEGREVLSLQRYVVSPEEAGQRLDLFLAQKLGTESSRSYLKKLILEDRVCLPDRGGKRPKPSERLRLGDRVDLSLPPPLPSTASPEAIPLHIYYEDDHLLLVEKPVGMVVHPAPGHSTGTLVNALLHHCRFLSGINGVLRPGIVHRLDRDTSGVLVVAKTDQAHRGLADLFLTRPKDKIQRRYLAVIRGQMPEPQGLIETWYYRHPIHRQKFTSKGVGGKQAITEFWVNEDFGIASLLEVRLHTGRTHQIRVHFSDQQKALIGDSFYGPPLDKTFPLFLQTFPRQALHAYRLAFVHPVTQAWIEATSPLPDDLRLLLQHLRGLPKI